MGKIQILDEHMTNLIAAGEVIERACSVVKELVENSIDAGSTNINISLVDSGLNEIRVSDNGSGMDNIDAKMAIVPHATSKIKTQNDLFTIGTLGFRGEALASIVAVSNFKLITSTDGYRGIMLSLRGGIPLSEATIAHPKGTEIIVKNLFFNTPARLQNLQAQNVELAYITDYVSKMAIAHNDISFTLINNGKELIHSYGNGNLLEVVSEIYSNDVAKEMISIFDNNGIFKIEGYISKISVTRSSKNNITLIINGRIVHNASLVNAVISGYGNLLMNFKYPIAIIAITVDLGMVDVNVHPSKYEVRLSDEATLREMITNTISKVLTNVDLSVNISSTEMNKVAPIEEIKEEKEESPKDDYFNDPSYFGDTLKTDEDNNNIEEEKETQEDIDDSLEDTIEKEEDTSKDAVLEERDLFTYNDELEDKDNNLDLSQGFEKEEIEEITDSVKPIEKETEEVKEKYTPLQYSFVEDEIVDEKPIVKDNTKISKMYYIGQLFGTYILAQNEDNFFLIDQHAANERVNYEKIKNDLLKNNNATYELLVPITLQFTPAEVLMIKEKMDLIENLGVRMEEFGSNTFVVRQIPIWIFRGREREFVEEIIIKIIQEKGETKTDFLDSLAKSLACKKSIKGNEFHTSLEIEYLLEELAKTSNPFTCPHGRPVIVKLAKQDIEKWFKRIV